VQSGIVVQARCRSAVAFGREMKRKRRLTIASDEGRRREKSDLLDLQRKVRLCACVIMNF
jgi:hypothetical protein